MTSLHPTPTDPARPDPAADRTGATPRAAARCSIAQAADAGQLPGAPGGGARDDSVPRPRSGPGDADGGAPLAGPPFAGVPLAAAPLTGAPDERTAARVQAALTERLRAARQQGRTLAELAAACRRPAAEVAALLGEPVPVEAPPTWRVQDDQDGRVGREDAHAQEVRQPAAPAAERSVPVLRAAREEPRALPARRPSPSRRLRRMHPDAAPTGREAAERETAAPEGPLPRRSARAAGRTATGANGVAGTTAAGTSTGGAGDGDGAEAAQAETPLGILIGAGPHQPEAVGRPEERTPVRVTAQPVRIGRGTSLVVLPSWRPAIAVSVPTEHVLSATGLAFEQLAGVQLTVMMNPGALHDRELDLHGWQAVRGRRGGRA
ncbi:hypothetical protein PUR71_23430 [Streptomyces sp. SP17BM10]|uniref:hypothetical protein n=1 Tax=Streptomyces sp. SP17BM10 TaxID=3002530 RepID=UPI002E7A153E|nr:hypothetical protein [Streptomyces sp. SP17BM10]MEE1785833.1 hypothetical protein [Streptomyces sp. SP17BM10]